MKCQFCDNEIPANATTCPACGASAPQPPPQQNVVQPGVAPQPPPPQTVCNSTKSASTATLLSCLIVGVGQMYLGQVAKGILLLILAIVVSSASGGIGGLVIWIIAMIDANKIGKKMQAGRSVGPWEFF